MYIFLKESREGKITDSGHILENTTGRRRGPTRARFSGSEVRCLLASLIAPDFGRRLDLSHPLSYTARPEKSLKRIPLSGGVLLKCPTSCWHS